ncbi:metalloregulator ArsR/SmtB family transcription factor [Dyella sp. BiH032]|uniref:metalloregulator ArsR/SmtB family transcription factor n=1 Tax=Dyella sp. BiH032 TaxID=3075430 RepID=UPI0028933984|nr:metalloregulator ArsR/SmtB family transcription factor [Dyella sp. BiH032]WNL46120.1 metalloregulator ArsR/SmtB family transcription factor [Dyella sp. BiH032]
MTLNADMTRMARHAEEAAGLLKSLAHPTRLMVMCRLAEGEASVSELQQVAELSMSALSQHLAVLREASLVETRRQAQAVYYSLRPSAALGVIQALHDAYCKPRRR